MDRVGESRQRGGAGALAFALESLEVVGQALILDGHDHSARPAQDDDVERRTLAGFEALTDHVRSHLLDRAREPEHVGRREPERARGFPDEGESRHQVPGLGGQGETRDLLLRGALGVHGSLRSARTMNGRGG